MGYTFFSVGVLMSVPATYSLLAVRNLLRHTPHEVFLPDHLKRAVETHVDAFARLSMNVSVTVHQLFGKYAGEAVRSSDAGRSVEEFDRVAPSVLSDIATIRVHFTEIMARLALGGKFSELNSYVERKLTFAPEVLEFIRQEGGAVAVLDSVTRHLGRIERLIRDRMEFAVRREVEAFSASLLAAKLILKTVVGAPVGKSVRHD